jgi:hypothetical protein
MKFHLYLLVLLIFTALSSNAFAAVPAKIRFLQGSGSQTGGMAGTGFTLTGMRLSQDKKKKIERIVMDIGDKNGQSIKGLPGYFHIELKNNPQRLIVNLAQMPHSNVDARKLKEIFRQSLAVKNTALALDPIDSTLIVSMDLKKNTKVRVMQVAGKKQTSKVVLDLISE